MYISKMFTRDQGSSELQGPWTDHFTDFSYLSESIGTSYRSGPDISCQTGGGRGQKGLVISENRTKRYHFTTSQSRNSFKMLYSQAKIVLKITFWTKRFGQNFQKCQFWSKNDDDDEIKPDFMLQNMSQSRSRDRLRSVSKKSNPWSKIMIE